MSAIEAQDVLETAERGDELTDGITDLRKKMQSFLRFAGARNYDDLPALYNGPIRPPLSSNMKNWKPGLAKSSQPGPNWTLFFDTLLSAVSSSFTRDVFFSSSYEEFLDSVPAETRPMLDPSTSRDQRITIYIDPKDHSLDLEEEWCKSKVVDQRFMYISRFAVNDWNKLIEYERYETYVSCKKLLEQTLADEIFDDVDAVILLGAGSYDKDREIVKRLSNGRSGDHPIRVILIDASFYMLVDTYTRLRSFIDSSKINCTIEMYCFDFGDADAWKKNIRLPQRYKSAFFLLGGTVGNLREGDFLEVLRKCVDVNDVVCIAGEFFETKQHILENEPELRKRYDNDEAKDLALGAINDILNREMLPKSVAQRREFVSVKLEEARRLKGPLLSSIPDTMAITFTTKGIIETPARTFPPLALVTAKRYVKDNFVQALELDCDLIEHRACDHPTKRFSHIIFRKRGAQIDPLSEA